MIDKAIALMNKLMNEVDQGRLKLQARDWDDLSSRLEPSAQELEDDELDDDSLEEVSQDIVANFEEIARLNKGFAEVLEIQLGSRTKDTAGRLRKSSADLTDIPPLENKVIKLRRQIEKIEARAQQAQKSEQQS